MGGYVHHPSYQQIVSNGSPATCPQPYSACRREGQAKAPQQGISLPASEAAPATSVQLYDIPAQLKQTCIEVRRATPLLARMHAQP